MRTNRTAQGFLLNLVCSLFLFTKIFAQSSVADTLTIMSYNTLDYGFPPTKSCPGLITQNKHGYLRTILRYTQPDILGLVKNDATPSSFTKDSIISEVLDSICQGCFAHSPYTNLSGYIKEDMLYYKKNKLGLVSNTNLYSGDSSISDINLTKLYIKDSLLATTHDTTFINFIIVHLASGTGSAAQRATEVNGAMATLDSIVKGPGNYVFMGDLNVQSSSEACFQSLINSANPNTKFNDPVNQLGNWAKKPLSFANYLTDDTRSVQLTDCGANNTMSTRFQHILLTQPLIDGTQKIAYIPNSYTIVGQDGKHTNGALIDSPTNISAPASVINALYYMSNHLPLTLKVKIQNTLLPINILTIKTSYIKNNVVEIDLQDNIAVQLDKLTIQRSENGIQFNDIYTQSIQQRQQSFYKYFDTLHSITSTTYYRLKGVDIHGGVTFSQISSLKNTYQQFLSIFPNPIKQGILHFVNADYQAKKTSFFIYNTQGKLIKMGIVNNNIQDISLTTLENGIYYFVLENGQSAMFKKQ